MVARKTSRSWLGPRSHLGIMRKSFYYRPGSPAAAVWNQLGFGQESVCMGRGEVVRRIVES